MAIQRMRYANIAEKVRRTSISSSSRSTNAAVIIRPLRENDLARADQVMRLAFGTFLRLSDPTLFMGDADYVFTRFAADPTAAFAAELDGQLVGSNFATNWGSVSFFGPLTVHPDVQASGLGSALMEPVMERFAAWGTRHAGLYTFADSPKHIGLYQKFGFFPRFLTAIMERTVPDAGARTAASTLSGMSKHERDAALADCRTLTDSIYEGLDLTHEIAELQRQSLGEAVLLDDEKGISGVAVCHCGPRTEAGSGVLFIKFGAVRPGPRAEHRFEQLLDACEETARARGLARVVGGVNFGRTDAYRAMSSRGYRASDLGVAMHRPNESGYSRPDIYLIDDWR